MDKPISVGDLVMVIRPSLCTGSNDGIGHVFKVHAVLSQSESDICFYCGIDHPGFFASDRSFAWPLRRLKRIDPDALKDDVPTREELTA